MPFRMQRNVTVRRVVDKWPGANGGGVGEPFCCTGGCRQNRYTPFKGSDRNPVQQQANRFRLQFQTSCSVLDYAMSRSASGTYLDHVRIKARSRVSIRQDHPSCVGICGVAWHSVFRAARHRCSRWRADRRLSGIRKALSESTLRHDSRVGFIGCGGSER